MIHFNKILLIIIGCLIAAICVSVYFARNGMVDFEILTNVSVDIKTPGMYVREINTSSHPEFLLIYNPMSDKILYQTYKVEAKVDTDTLKIYIVEKPAATESQISPRLNVLFRPTIKPSSVEVYLNGQKQPIISR